MKKLLLILISALMLAGCNTMRGFGQDMEKAGDAIQKKSSE